MLCAHTVRRLKPGTFDQFAADFGPPGDAAPAGWVRFHMLRKLDDENEVITFGFFDGTFEELERSQKELGHSDRRSATDQYVDRVMSNGVYEVVVSRTPEGAPAA
jgi:hypothetical protein